MGHDIETGVPTRCDGEGTSPESTDISSHPRITSSVLIGRGHDPSLQLDHSRKRSEHHNSSWHADEAARHQGGVRIQVLPSENCPMVPLEAVALKAFLQVRRPPQ